MNTYSVYAHISPSNKVYIGITNKNPIYRWNNGNGYNRKGKPQNKEWITKRMLSHNKPIEVFINNEWVYYKSITEASNSLNIERNNISSVCRGKRKTAGGLKFRFYDHNRI